MKVFELLAEPSSWCQADYARDSKGVFIDGDDPWLIARDWAAISWCLAGAIYKCYEKDEADVIIDRVTKHLGVSVESWNDKSGRTHEEVINVCKELNI